ncbi:MAG TPA: hypothetical protein VGS12_15390 [Caulobacteraceae bacterium]|nr:hypothetical protein [Caulobacteraceae bacterium]
MDASFQYFLADHDVITVNGRWVHEDETFNASFPLGLSTNRSDSMDELRGQVSSYWSDKIGLTVAPFDIAGSADSLLYSRAASASARTQCDLAASADQITTTALAAFSRSSMTSE